MLEHSAVTEKALGLTGNGERQEYKGRSLWDADGLLSEAQRFEHTYLQNSHLEMGGSKASHHRTSISVKLHKSCTLAGGVEGEGAPFHQGTCTTLAAVPRFDIHLFSHCQSAAPFPQRTSCKDPGALSTDEWFTSVCVGRGDRPLFPQAGMVSGAPLTGDWELGQWGPGNPGFCPDLSSMLLSYRS